MYKLGQHLRKNDSPEKVQTPIEIKSRTVCKWLYKLGFKYKNVKKNVFVDKYEQPDVVEDCEKFLNIMKDLKPYLVEFEEDESMKTKNYLNHCAIKRDVHCSVIVITYDKCTLFANDRIQKT